VALAPVVAGVGMSIVNPDYMEPMFNEGLGRFMLMLGGTMMLLGFLVIRQMVNIKF
jgi:tight adherence protein B